jgi:MoaA/NifB/PqqE/SkfB family radical SAM enzyme
VGRRLRGARLVARALTSTHHPIMAQIVPIRRCNLACAYCTEYDHSSPPVPVTEMRQRIDRLAALGTTIIDISGGEPLMHPEVDELIRHIRGLGLFASLITNGYLLNAARITRLNRAGLDHLQISIDNVRPDDVSKKSLAVLDQKLVLLARHATFDVTINSVLGGDLVHPSETLAIARRARELGFNTTVGLIHDGSGQLRPLSPEHRLVYDQIAQLTASVYAPAKQNRFQRNLVRGEPNAWQCRAGSRYLYVCENGLVHWCSQQRGYPGIPLSEYTVEHLEREFRSTKSCAPYCTVSCVHRVSVLDDLRERGFDSIQEMLADPGTTNGAPARRPALAQAFTWMFVTSANRAFFRRAALRVLGVR